MWILLLVILPGIVMAADQRTVTFQANAGPPGQQQSPVQQQQPNGNPASIGLSMADSYTNNQANPFYRSLEMPPNLAGGQGAAIFPPEVPNFYFNAGFNKGLGFRVPDALTGANYYGTGQHTPLGELWATKADLLPAIFKTGFFFTAILAILKVVVFLIHSKHSLLLPGLAGGDAATAAVASAPSVPVLTVLSERGSSKSGSEDSRIKREASASPVVDPHIDFDQILAQLESIRARFD